ncbi:MAG: DUF1697 domain-containing protein [Candidatus Delongbacteria bacterium]|nr:DUF1697 domain-containing protein [Candidatus Delongbacteria bacterium]
MKYVALLRGINVGNSVKISMKELKELFETLGYTNVSTYINSGNVLFESVDTRKNITSEIQKSLLDKAKTEIKVLIKTKLEIIKIAQSIPIEWENNSDQKTDVAYLFDSIDNKKIIEELPIKKEYIQIKYVKGALIWNVNREHYNKSQLNKIISHKVYKNMTLRNVNTARRLAEF